MTHGVRTGKAVERITSSRIEMLTLTDSIPATDAVKAAHNIRQITISGLLARAMRAVSDESSVSSLFD